MAGTLRKVRIVRAWKHYRVGDTLTPNGTVRDFLVNQGYAVFDEAETPARPAKLSARAAKKIAEGAKNLFGG